MDHFGHLFSHCSQCFFFLIFDITFLVLEEYHHMLFLMSHSDLLHLLQMEILNLQAQIKTNESKITMMESEQKNKAETSERQW